MIRQTQIKLILSKKGREVRQIPMGSWVGEDLGDWRGKNKWVWVRWPAKIIYDNWHRRVGEEERIWMEPRAYAEKLGPAEVKDEMRAT